MIGTNFYDFKVQGLDGSPDILGSLRGKVKPTDPTFLQDLSEVL
jgi:hypothetical protein